MRIAIGVSYTSEPANQALHRYLAGCTLNCQNKSDEGLGQFLCGSDSFSWLLCVP